MYLKNITASMGALALIFTNFLASAQTEFKPKDTHKSSIIFEIETENGGMLTQKNVKNITYEGAYYNGINARIGWKATGKKDQYHQIYNYPTYGVGFYSSTFNSDIIGNPNAVYGFVQTPIASKKNNRWEHDYRIGLGLSGNFNPYDENRNPLNLVIGSKTNVFVDLAVRTQYRFHPKWRVGAGFAFHHFSNGALSLPNKGINLVPLTVSINYQPRTFIPYKRTVLQPYPKGIVYDISYAAGVKQLDKEVDTRYFKTTLGFYASKHISYKWRLGLGYDIFYSESGKHDKIAGYKAGKLGSLLSGGPSFYIVHVLNNKLTLNGNIGYYIHNQHFNGEIKKMFLRAGTRYYIYKNFNAGVSIKAHAGKADFIEWTLGYSFNKN
jgi:hypothetical protein